MGSKTEQKFPGLGVAPGVVVGVAHVRESGAITIPEYCLTPQAVDDEVQRFNDAVELARRQVRMLGTKAKTLPDAAAEEFEILIDAYLQMLDGSRLIRGVERRITDEKMNAEFAVQSELNVMAAQFAEMDDAYLAARLEDIREVSYRLIRNLTKTCEQNIGDLPEGSIVIAEEMTPADTALIDPAKVLGFATVIGGAEGHTAIMARALSMPAVLGASGLIKEVRTGDLVVVDGDNDQLILHPSEKTLLRVKNRQELQRQDASRLHQLADLDAVTRDGTRVTLNANVELPIEMDNVVEKGAEGVGLLRSEFIFMNRSTLPNEDEQYEIFKNIVGRMKGRPVTVRTLDIGGEKIAPALVKGFGESAKSALGLRGVRLSLKQPEIFEAQIAAILRAGAHGPVRLLIPMVTTVAELRKTKEIIKSVRNKLIKRGIQVADQLPQIGIMIEVPGAALAADALAMACDFMAIGSNDLTMYTLATDRTDEQVAHLFNPLHPAVLRLMQFCIEAAHRANTPISLCGEIAGDPTFTAMLLGLGLRDLSMSAANIPKVKQRIRELDLDAAKMRANMIMGQTDSGRSAMLLDDFNALAS
ncbi:MAG: phosphoenolpyruvate--protein phosphotransferase [Alphaproteobacteria bacterium]|nr:phosphoenolpyruvate--protein phosphotransferase [Rhodospirillales bacterium]MCW9045286.1 phosphoenolpyruvate--protein phosphotransferase [Alphaproteobacteria bacterium]